MFKLFNLFNWVQNLVDSFTFYGGGKGGGGGGGPQTQTSYSTNLPEYAKPFYEELMKQSSKQVYTTDPKGNVTGVRGFTPYTGERIAGFTPGQESVQRDVASMETPGGFGTAASGLGMGTGLGFGAAGAGLGQAFGYSPMAISGGTFDAPAASYYMSPYQSGVTDIAVREAEKQRDLARTGRMTGAIGRGTFGGARQTLADVEAERGAAQGISDIRTRGQQEAFMNAQQQFERDQARRMQAAQLGQQAQQFGAGLGKDIGLAGLQAGMEGAAKTGALAATEQASNLERLKAQAASAAEPQAMEQERLNQQYQQFMDQQNYQKQQLEYLSNILRGNAAALGTTQTQYAPAPSLASQLGGMGLAGLGLYNILGKK
jgi:PIN domain nuclease of toxin-antitoxin system